MKQKLFSKSLKVTETYKIFLTRHAENDLIEIYDYIAVDSLVTASAFVLVLEEKVFSLSTMPERGPLIPENILLGTRYRHLIHGKYRIIFKVYDQTVTILRVIHGNMLLELQSR